MQWIADNSVLRRMPKNVWILGFVSMLMDISSEMIHSLMPIFMVTVLGTSALTVGIIEGFAEATALIIKIFSGALSDYLGKRKGLAVFGYGIAALTKPLFALANSVGVVVTARMLDRLGKGVRGAPRDALVADEVTPDMRGAAFGLRHALDTAGAFLGPLLAMVLMLLFTNDFRWVFWFAAIPAFAAVAMLVFGLKEKAATTPKEKRTNPLKWNSIKQLSGAYWWVVIIGAVFTLARFSEAFLVLRAQQSQMSLAFIPLVMVLMNVIYSFSAYPFGRLSDRMNHKHLLALGLLVLIAADLVLAASSHWGYLLVGISLWGIHLGMTQGLLAAMVANMAPAHLRGTAFGFFNLVCGLCMLPASALAGYLWTTYDASVTFYTGALFCGLAFLGLLLPISSKIRMH